MLSLLTSQDSINMDLFDALNVELKLDYFIEFIDLLKNANWYCIAHTLNDGNVIQDITNKSQRSIINNHLRTHLSYSSKDVYGYLYTTTIHNVSLYISLLYDENADDFVIKIELEPVFYIQRHLGLKISLSDASILVENKIKNAMDRLFTNLNNLIST